MSWFIVLLVILSFVFVVLFARHYGFRCSCGGRYVYVGSNNVRIYYRCDQCDDPISEKIPYIIPDF